MENNKKLLITKDNKKIIEIPVKYLMTDELKARGISGGFLSSILKNIPIIGSFFGDGISGLDGKGISGLSGKGIHGFGITGLGISGGYANIEGGFIQALLPFVPSILSMIPSVIDLFKGKGISGSSLKNNKYKFSFISGKGVDYEEEVKIPEAMVEVLKHNPEIILNMKQNVENMLKEKTSGQGFRQSFSQIDTGAKGEGIKQSFSQIDMGAAGISGRACYTTNGIAGNSIFGDGFKSKSKIYKNAIGEL